LKSNRNASQISKPKGRLSLKKSTSKSKNQSSQSQLDKFNQSPKSYKPHLLYESNKELSGMKKQEASQRQKSKTKVTLNLSKNGISMSKNLTPSDIELIQGKLERAKASY